MAPEIVQGRQMVAPLPPSDVYSFGLMLWEILARKRPFDAFSVAQVVAIVGFGGAASRLQPSVAEVFRFFSAEKVRITDLFVLKVNEVFYLSFLSCWP